MEEVEKQQQGSATVHTPPNSANISVQSSQQ